ncbi:hypothetical protein COO60DRAFT_1686772 [Scenedesmus sp. NREL 46B-D3]|nr:hypothetical protein COO60DRAFT_1686772 [Scenedesmus sp. NREL 46B-D3]
MPNPTTDQETGRARDFAHVEFENADAAAKAVKLNGQLDPGAALSRNGGASDGTTIFVKGFDTSEGDDAARAALQEVFGECGEVTNIRLPSDRESGELKGIAYIEYGSADANEKASELNGSEAADGYLKVDVNVQPRIPGSAGGFVGGRGGGFGGRGGGFGGRGGGRGGDRGEWQGAKLLHARAHAAVAWWRSAWSTGSVPGCWAYDYLCQ